MYSTIRKTRTEVSVRTVLLNIVVVHHLRLLLVVVLGAVGIVLFLLLLLIVVQALERNVKRWRVVVVAWRCRA